MQFQPIATVFAQAAAPAQPSPLMTFLPLILMMVAMWFLLIAPQRKKMKELQKMVEALSTGDEVLTSGGLYGTVAQRKEDRFVLKISENTKVEVDKSAITAVTKKS